MLQREIHHRGIFGRVDHDGLEFTPWRDLVIGERGDAEIFRKMHQRVIEHLRSAVGNLQFAARPDPLITLAAIGERNLQPVMRFFCAISSGFDEPRVHLGAVEFRPDIIQLQRPLPLGNV